MNIKKITILLAITLLASAAILLFYREDNSDSSDSWKRQYDPKVIKNVTDMPTVIPDNDTDINNVPEGKLLLTLKSDRPGTKSFLATMDATTGETEEISLNNLTLDKDEVLYGATVSPDKTQIAFAVTDLRNQKSDIFTAPIRGGAAKKITITPVNSYNTLSPPQWQRDKTLIFSYKESGQIFEYRSDLEKHLKKTDWAEVDERSHVISLRNGVATDMVSGFFPQIYGRTDTILISQNDGLYLYNTKKDILRNIVVVVASNENLVPARLNKKLSLSKDGKRIAWSNVSRSELYIFETKDSGITYEPYARYPVAGFWTTFSPDGKYLALQSAEEIEPGIIPENPYIIIYDLEKHTIVAKHNLYEYDQGTMWLTDWIYDTEG